MLSAETGDDVYGEDPTVNALEALGAQLTNKESALFVSSGTQGNLLALLSHCDRGEEYIAGQDSHTYRYEGGGGAVLGGIAPQPIPFNERGELDLELLQQTIKPDNFHFARTKLVCLENTTGGKVLSQDYLSQYAQVVSDRGLKRHLDGARVFNAAVKMGVPVSEITQYFDTVSICLSKGLAAPVGSLLVGDRETIVAARRWRKMLGGGMRQAGILAAAGIYALNNNVERLAEDHAHAGLVADAVKQLSFLGITADPQTNMVLLSISDGHFASLKQFLGKHQITISTPRLVFHRDVSSDDVQTLIALLREFDQQQ